LPQILEIARPGDVIGHVYSAMPDGVLGDDEAPSPALIEAAAQGLLLGIGYGINFSYATACRMIAGGLWPDIISIDVHGLFSVTHDDNALDYSLAGAFARIVALDMSFHAALSAVTLNPALVLGEMIEIGTLAVGLARRCDGARRARRGLADTRRPGRSHRDAAAADSPTRAASGAGRSSRACSNTPGARGQRPRMARSAN
jgi:predicted amidohydrolase